MGGRDPRGVAECEVGEPGGVCGGGLEEAGAGGCRCGRDSKVELAAFSDSYRV